MSDNTKTEAENRPVAKTTLTYTMVHPAELDPSKMSADDVAYHLGDGDFVGARTAVETTPIEDSQVEAELEAVGGSPEFFKKPDDDLLS
ncbi:hypothetical protein [Erythrobacter aureus]|uniref:Uncharacterized protein n=1 Tax=Erythrobacter aureus TaxID=2182384 RepID=A0A345YJG5_9SPHN|nr:hypothetical protein [Erythrobacter aureus]AXK44067.1 hypothetical protein DVR09_16575 [Erythrobacter aureus]